MNTENKQPQTSLNLCPSCQHPYRIGTIICENCGVEIATGKPSQAGGTSKLEQDAIHDTQIASTNNAQTDAPAAEAITPEAQAAVSSIASAINTAGSTTFEDNMLLRLEIEGAPTPITIYPSYETVIGRRDPLTAVMPDVDLTSYAGYRMGVSRKHAVIRLQNKSLAIYDLGSSNGTFLNGEQLPPHNPHTIRDGDKIALGKMVIKLFFQVKK